MLGDNDQRYCKMSNVIIDALMMMIEVETLFGYIDIEEVALAVNTLCSLPSPRCNRISGNGGSLIQSHFLEIHHFRDP